jgi:uncharacterized protein (TIGR00369 family)
MAHDDFSQERVTWSFAKQGLMKTLGATLEKIAAGFVEIGIRPTSAISQQHGFTHAGAVSAIADSAAGYAALTLAPVDTGVLTTEFKINFIAPAIGDRIVARGRVVKAGRTLTVAQAEVFAQDSGQEELIALLTASIMTVVNREGINDYVHSPDDQPKEHSERYSTHFLRSRSPLASAYAVPSHVVS